MSIDINELLGLLKGIEETADIKIIHAGVVGSHDTGLNRPDSGIDLLFIYADKLEKYFDINEPKQIVHVGHGNINISAFSLKKAISMITESNPAIIHLLSCKHKIISMPSIFRQLESFAKEYYSPQRQFIAFSNAINRCYHNLLASEDKEIKTFLAYVRLSLSLHHCSCYGLVKNDFNDLVRFSELKDETKKFITDLTREYKQGKTHTSARAIKSTITEIEKLTKSTKFNYSIAPFIDSAKIRQFHMNTIVSLSKTETYM